MTVTYGAGKETHLLTQEVAGPAVFCEWRADTPETVVTDAGASPNDTSELHCDLWTSGPAVLEIYAPGFLPVRVELRPEQDDCGIVTKAVDVLLERLGAAASETQATSSQ